MAKKGFTVRLDSDVITQIREQFPEFDMESERGHGTNAKVLRKLVQAGLESDPKQMFAEELANVKEALRDNHEELVAVRRNFSTVLQLVLQNAARFKEDKVEETITELKARGKIV